MSSTEHPAGDMPGGEEREPTEEEVRAYLDRLRSTPADQVVAEVASALLNAAQVKLGRRDARLLIDVVAAVADQVRDQLDQQLTDQLDQALTQLRLGQVEAEKQVAAAAAQGHREEADLAESASPAGEDRGEPPAPGPGPAQQGGGEPSPASRLWIPGR